MGEHLTLEKVIESGGRRFGKKRRESFLAPKSKRCLDQILDRGFALRLQSPPRSIGDSRPLRGLLLWQAQGHAPNPDPFGEFLQ